MDESAERIYEAALGTPEEHSIIFLAHNGPTGLSLLLNLLRNTVHHHQQFLMCRSWFECGRHLWH